MEHSRMQWKKKPIPILFDYKPLHVATKTWKGRKRKTDLDFPLHKQNFQSCGEKNVSFDVNDIGFFIDIDIVWHDLFVLYTNIPLPPPVTQFLFHTEAYFYYYPPP